MDVEEGGRLATWLGDAEAAEARRRVSTAQDVFAFALSRYVYSPTTATFGATRPT